MSVGGHPGEVYKVECVSNGPDGILFVGGGVSIVVDGPDAKPEYYVVGKHYIVHVRPAPGSEPDGGDRASAAG